MYLVNSCGPGPTCLVATGQYEPQEIGGASFTYIFPSMGTYYLAVDGRAGECGPFQIAGSFHGPTTDVGPPGRTNSGVSLAAYPNPTPGAVVFRGTVPESRAAVSSITIVDVSGRRRAQIPIPTVGSYEVRWEGRDDSGAALAPGVYFAEVRVGGNAARRAIVLSR